MKGARPRVVVVGSFVMDLVFRVHHRPRKGETLLGEDFGMFLGGKGFNQAVACRRLGADVTAVGRTGKDYFGDLFLEKLCAEGIDADFVTRDPEVGTGVASPVVDAQGENSIIGVPRANMRVTPEDVDDAQSEIGRADVLMLQFEIPPAASRRAAEIARASAAAVLLDPAPVHHAVPFEGPVDYLVPNEVEAAMLAGRKSPSGWGQTLTRMAQRAVVVTLGRQGAVILDRQGERRVPGHRVSVVDTTGAGDAFRAGLAVMLAQDKSIEEAVRFANACGALACTVLGAEPSMPRRAAVHEFIED